MRYHEDPEHLTFREALALCRVDDIKPLVALVCGKVKARTEEMIDMLASALQGAEAVRALYDNLDDLGQKAVQEATHDEEGGAACRAISGALRQSPGFRWHGYVAQ
jgi:hypothetical protein